MNFRILMRPSNTGCQSLTLTVCISRLSQLLDAFFLLCKNLDSQFFLSHHWLKILNGKRWFSTTDSYLQCFRCPALQRPWFLPWITQDFGLVLASWLFDIKRILSHWYYRLPFVGREMGLLSFNQTLDLKAGPCHWQGKEYFCILIKPRWLGS